VKRGDPLRRFAGGMTLIELLLAVSLMAVVAVIAFSSFAAVTGAWRRGLTLSERLHHGDFVMEQLAMGLRSTYFPDTDRGHERYGFRLSDEGDGAGVSDEIAWVKVGGSLVGDDKAYAAAPHRVRFDVGETREGEGARVRAWRVKGLPEDFDPEEDVEPELLSRRVIGFNCRTLSPEDVSDEGELDWQDEWHFTNDLPLALELTLYLEPTERGGEAPALRRVVEVPVAYLCEPWVRTGGL
jgi:prepilin-type N-terminal cleavage/methylation domain-containing protein